MLAAEVMVRASLQVQDVADVSEPGSSCNICVQAATRYILRQGCSVPAWHAQPLLNDIGCLF